MIVSSDKQSAAIDAVSLCAGCQHSVEVRGIEQVVCLAYLSVRDPITEDVCKEFEHKRKKIPAAAVD
jgi:hypothetical protein